ncbi:MAG TPA: glycosyltransferase family 39 protein, partial [Actinomycetota bacterium]|nr:glycosyltransferase family 39 protein [Actinomycetota bacterium]
DREGTTPTYFLVMWPWVRAFGDGEVALRSLSALAGIVTVPVAYAAALALDQSRRVARIAAVIVAVSPLLVWSSQEARVYSLLALAAACSLWAFGHARRGTRNSLAAWAVAAAALVSLHYFGVFLVAAEAAALLVALRPRWQPVALALIPTAVVGLLLVPFALRQYSHGGNRSWITGFSLPARIEEAGKGALVGPSPPFARLWVSGAIIVAVAAALLATRTDARDRRVAVTLAAMGAAAVVAPLAIALVGTDAFLGRYLIGALLPLVLAVAVGLGASRPAAPGLVAAGALVAISLVAVVTVARDPELQRPDWRAVAAVVADAPGPRLVVVDVNGGQSGPLAHYLAGATALAPDDEVEVDGIDVLVGLAPERPCNMLVGHACGMVYLGAVTPGPSDPPFTRTERIELDQFALDRYRADEPVPVSVGELTGPDAPDAVVWMVDPTR